jgi:hypothetical protein
MARSQSSRITSVDDVDKLHTLYDAARVHI